METKIVYSSIGLIMILALVLMVAPVVVVTSVLADATPDHYASPSGTNTAPYDTWANAAHSIQDAINAAGAGDTVHVAAATYNENIVVDKEITLKGAQAGKDVRNPRGAETIVDAAPGRTAIHVLNTIVGPVTIDGFTFKGKRATVYIESDTSRFFNNIVYSNGTEAGSPPALVYIDGPAGAARDVVVQYNDITPSLPGDVPSGCNALRINVHGTASVLVDNNHLHNGSNYPGALGAGLGIYASDPGATITVTNNEMDNNGSDGMFTYNSTFDSLTISDNDIHDNSEQGIKIAPNVQGNVDISNNSIYNNTQTGVKIQSDVQVNAHYNRIYSNTNYGIENLGSVAVDAENNWWGDASGPDGTGDKIYGDVDYDPWLTTDPAPTGCFIATAAYGTPMAEEIEVLREFRDRYLLNNPVGKALVELYYKVSPPMAEFITEHPTLKPVVRAGLVPAIAMSTVAVNTTLAQKIAIVSSMVLLSALLVVWLRKRTGRGSIS